MSNSSMVCIGEKDRRTTLQSLTLIDDQHLPSWNGREDIERLGRDDVVGCEDTMAKDKGEC